VSDRPSIHIGTSGWHYPHWHGVFYPAEMPARELLGFYCQHFHTVEINNSFYHLPARQTFRLWYQQTPKNFCFAVKASRYITHMKKLKDAQQPVAVFLSHVRGLKEKLGPILFQLPPRWRRDPERLSQFLEALPRGYRYAFEFRDPSWFHEETYAQLRRRNAAFCVYDLAGQTSPRLLTADFAYLRLHGPSAFKYQGRYSRRQLAAWWRTVQGWLREVGAIYVYFDNDQNGYAALNAQELRQLAASH